MNKELAKAIVRSFSQSGPAKLLSSFSTRDWRSVGTWLDTSGIALYLLERLKTLGIQQSLPRTVLSNLQLKARQHAQQVDEQFTEFTAIVNLFQQHGVPFAVQKGYSLIPDYSPDPAHRLQVDFDFWVSAEATPACHQLLIARGYEVVFKASDAYQHEWKFRKGETGYPTLSDLYKPKGEFTVEVHNRTTSMPLNPEILALKKLRGIAFPVLPKTEVFAEQCMHAYRHLQSEQTRLSWILEYHNFLRLNREDRNFEGEIRQRYAEDPNFAAAFIFVTSFATEIFGDVMPPWFAELKARDLSRGVHSWLRRYAWDIALAKFPGTKLYLLLEHELSNHPQDWSTLVRRALLPLRMSPERVMASTPSVRQNRQYRGGRLRHAFARTEFHMREGCRVFYELIRWRITQCKTPFTGP